MESPESDAELVAHALAGETEAFVALVDHYYSRLQRHLTFVTGDAELASDITQEAFLTAFRKLDQLHQREHFAAWLRTIANHTLQSEWRRRLRHPISSLDELDRDDLQPDRIKAPTAFVIVEEQEIVIEVLESLTPRLRDVLRLGCVDGLKAPEIAKHLGISLAAAERRLSRAKAEFRRHYLFVIGL